MPLDFEISPLGFDLDNALYFATACELAAERIENRQQAGISDSLAIGGPDLQTFEFTGEDAEEATYRGFMGSNDQIAVVAYADVENLDPWLKDASMVQKTGFGGLVHKGFAESLESLWSGFDLEDLIGKAFKGKDIWITGHGLGGALAVLTAARLDSQGTSIKGVYTFGSPRIGNIDFYYTYGVKTYRVVNNNDIYAHVPAEITPVGGFHLYSYKHVGTLRYLDRHKHLAEGCNNWERKKEMIKNQLLRMIEPPTNWFQDHHISNYVAALKHALYGDE